MLKCFRMLMHTSELDNKYDVDKNTTNLGKLEVPFVIFPKQTVKNKTQNVTTLSKTLPNVQIDHFSRQPTSLKLFENTRYRDFVAKIL